MGDEEAGEKPVIGKSLLEKFCHLSGPRVQEDIVNDKKLYCRSFRTACTTVWEGGPRAVFT